MCSNRFTPVARQASTTLRGNSTCARWKAPRLCFVENADQIDHCIHP